MGERGLDELNLVRNVLDLTRQDRGDWYTKLDYHRAAWAVRAMSKTKTKRWSKHITQTSNSLDLEAGIFARNSARSIALSLKRSADRSKRRKGEPFRSAMSMLNFYINRAGSKLSKAKRNRLQAAKQELRNLYGRKRAAMGASEPRSLRLIRSGGHLSLRFTRRITSLHNFCFCLGPPVRTSTRVSRASLSWTDFALFSGCV